MCHIFIVRICSMPLLFSELTSCLGCHDRRRNFKVSFVPDSQLLQTYIPFSVSIDPNLGGCTRVQGGWPMAILSAGARTCFKPRTFYSYKAVPTYRLHWINALRCWTHVGRFRHPCRKNMQFRHRCWVINALDAGQRQNVRCAYLIIIIIGVSSAHSILISQHDYFHGNI